MNALLNNATRVVEINGRWFITIGNPGFNSPANNRNGYATEEAAMAASLRYEQRRVEAFVARN